MTHPLPLTNPATPTHLAEVKAQCLTCGVAFTIPIGGTPRTWVIGGDQVARSDRGWTHRRCGGRLRLLSDLPEGPPQQIVLERELSGTGKDLLALADTWRDRFSADVVRHPVIAELLGQCARCGSSFTVRIGGSPRTWVIQNSEVDRSGGGWVHSGCGGRLRLIGRLPEGRPGRILLNRDQWSGR